MHGCHPIGLKYLKMFIILTAKIETMTEDVEKKI